MASLSELFGYEHSLLLLLDEQGERLFTIASHGYPSEGVGSEVRVGDGVIGMVADRVEPMRIGNLGRMLAYARTLRKEADVTQLEAVTPDGDVYVVRQGERGVVAIAAHGSLAGVVQHDLRTLLGRLSQRSQEAVAGA